MLIDISLVDTTLEVYYNQFRVRLPQTELLLKRYGANVSSYLMNKAGSHKLYLDLINVVC